MSKRKKPNPHKLFEAAYDKAAKLSAGDKNTLTNAGMLTLRAYLYRGWKIVTCQLCKHGTRNKDRPGIPAGVRLCGPCSIGKTDFWKD